MWEGAKRFRPDWFVDLHEGGGFHQENSKTVGSSVIVSRVPRPTPWLRSCWM